MNIEEYIESVIRHIENKAFINTVKQELRGHIDDRILYYEEIGYNSQTAQQKAIEHMGDADTVGEKMNMLHDYKKHKIISVIGFVIFIINLAVLRFSTYLLDNRITKYLFIPNIFLSLLITFMVYRYALVSRDRTVLLIQSIVSLCTAVYYISIYDTPSFLAGIIFFIHFVICLTCFGEVNALIKGKSNTKILERYNKYQHFLIIAAILYTIITIIYFIL